MLAAYFISPDREAIVNALMAIPGFVSAGVALQNPFAPRSAQFSAYEVHWLRGRRIPPLPPTIDGYPTKLVIVDDYPRPY